MKFPHKNAPPKYILMLLAQTLEVWEGWRETTVKNSEDYAFLLGCSHEISFCIAKSKVYFRYFIQQIRFISLF